MLLIDMVNGQKPLLTQFLENLLVAKLKYKCLGVAIYEACKIINYLSYEQLPQAVDILNKW